MAHAIRRLMVLLSIIAALTSCYKVSNVANSQRMDQPMPVSAENKRMVADALELPVVAKLDGKYLKAFLAAYSSFKDDTLVPVAKREIKNYEIEFREHGNRYFVLFLAKHTPAEHELLGGESELGKDVIYTIDGERFEIVDKKFYK